MPVLSPMNGRADLSPDFLDHLRRNGLQAHVAFSGNGPLLVVRTQDSPYKTYPISQQQLSDLTGWGSNSANKKAFTTLCDVIRKDFDVPQSMVAFTNANGHVNMGLHGYTVSRDEMRRGSVEVLSPSPGTLGRMAPNQAGYHLRRMPDSVIVPERADGSLKPGELLSGTYGFYYKGDRQETAMDRTRQMSESIIDSLAGLDRAVAQQTAQDVRADQPEQKAAPTLRTFPPAERYSDLIYSDMAFSNEKWLECLSSHGIIIATDKATLTVESSVTGQDRTYGLTADELGVLAQSELDDSPVARRLDMINAITSPDFWQQVTMEALDSDRHIDFRQAGLYVGEWDTYKPTGERILDEKAKDPDAVGTYYEARPGMGGQTVDIPNRPTNNSQTQMTEEQASGQSFEKREATNYSEDAYAGWRPMMQTPPERSLKMILLDTLNGISSSPATMMAMLPDMLIGMGNTSFSERNNAVPLACLFAGLFTSKQNPLLRNLLMVMGGSGLLMNAGETLRVDEAAQRSVSGPMYKIYADEPLDAHISDLEVRGRQMVCYYDGTLYRFNMTDDMRGAMDAGALPVNTLANRVFAAMAQSRQLAESNYEEASQSLDGKNDISRGIR